MKWAVIVLVLAGGFFAWKHFSREKEPVEPAEAPAADKTKTTGGNLNNRVETLSGSAPDPDAR